jgi:hypothetical protein
MCSLIGAKSFFILQISDLGISPRLWSRTLLVIKNLVFLKVCSCWLSAVAIVQETRSHKVGYDALLFSGGGFSRFWIILLNSNLVAPFASLSHPAQLQDLNQGNISNSCLDLQDFKLA